MIAGAAMTATGAITGNRTLSKWGGVLSLAGGVAGLATGAWSTTASSLATESSSVGAGGLAQEGFRAAEYAAAAPGGASYDALAAVGAANDSVGAVGAVSGSSALGPATVNLGSAGGTMSTAGGVGGAADVVKQGIADATARGIPGVAQSAPGVTGTIAESGAGNGGMLDSLKSAMTWAEKNPRLTQAGAGLLQSGLGAYGQQEAIKEQIKMQEDAQARARQRMNDSVKGVTVPVYVPRKG